MNNILRWIVCCVAIVVLLFGAICAIDIFLAHKPIDVKLIQEKYGNYYSIIQQNCDRAECQIIDQTDDNGIYYFYTFAEKENVAYTVSFICESTGREKLKVEISKENSEHLSVNDFSLLCTIVQEFSKMDYEKYNLEKEIENLLSQESGGIRIERNTYIGFFDNSNTVCFESLLQ